MAKDSSFCFWGGSDCQEAIADAESEVGAVAVDGDRSFVIVDEGEDVDVCVLAGVEGAPEEFPQVEGEEVFLGDKAEALGHTIVQDVVAVVSKGLEAGEQIVDQLMQRDFDLSVGGFEG
jgi:hypothetical protein